MTVLNRRMILTGSATIATAAMIPTFPAFSRAITQFRPNGAGDMSHTAFDEILKSVVRPDGQGYNKVDYRALKARYGELNAYVTSLEAQKPSTFSADAAHAYWINLYNAKTLEVVVGRYPVTSIKKINLGGGGLFGSGPWSKKIMTVEGTELTLDDVEHNIVRALFRDPMSHYALNCASYSCPNLATKAFTASNLNALMRKNAVEYVNHKRGINLDGSDITASKIYRWYADDFGGRSELKAHWSRFAKPELKSGIQAGRIDRYVYDWTLNDI